MKKIVIFVQAFIMVLLTTLMTYLIAQDKLWWAFLAGIGISITWTMNTRSVSSGCLTDRVTYVVGATCGSAVVLFVLPYFI